MMKDESPTVTYAKAGNRAAPATQGVRSAFDLGKGTGTSSRRPRMAFDVQAVKIEAGVAIPPKIGGKGGISGYALLASRMKPGDVAWLEQRHAYGLKVWFRKAGQSAEVRKMPDGRYGLWLGGAPTPPSTPKKPATAPTRKAGKR